MCFAGVWAELQPVFQLSETSKHADGVKHFEGIMLARLKQSTFM